MRYYLYYEIFKMAIKEVEGNTFNFNEYAFCNIYWFSEIGNCFFIDFFFWIFKMYFKNN